MGADRRVIFLAAGLRSSAVGLSGIILALHLSLLGFNTWSIGLAISLGLTGCAIGTVAVPDQVVEELKRAHRRSHDG